MKPSSADIRFIRAAIAGMTKATQTGADPTELDALIAYLQILGQMVDFTSFDAAGPNLR